MARPAVLRPSTEAGFACESTLNVRCQWGWTRQRHCWWLVAEDGSGLGQRLMAAPVGGRSGVVKTVVVASAPVIMQQSFLFIFLEVPQIQFNSECRTCMQSVHGYGRRSCELCRKSHSFHRRSSGVLFVRNAWVDSGYMLCNGSRVLLDVLTHCLREGGNSDPEVDFVLLSGVEAVHASRWLHVEILGLDDAQL